MTNIYLTYDDGPDNVYTPQLLDIFKLYNIKSTFFFIGFRVLEFPDVVLQTYKDGHRIGNHTYTHGIPTSPQGFPSYNGFQLYENEVKPTQQAIKQVIGVDTNLYRPPYLAVYGDQKTYIESVGFDFNMPTIDPRDWETTVTAEQIFNRVVSGIVVGSNNNILLHSGSRANGVIVAKQQTVDATIMIIEYCLNNGYNFKYIGQ